MTKEPLLKPISADGSPRLANSPNGERSAYDWRQTSDVSRYTIYSIATPEGNDWAEQVTIYLKFD